MTASFGAGVHGDRIVRRSHHVLFHEDFGQCGVHRVQFDVGDVILGHLETGDTVGRDRYLDRADLVAIPAGACLPAGGVAAFTDVSNRRTAATVAPAVPAKRLRRVKLVIGVSP